MSASLVGSEMCIRDRSGAAPPRPPDIARATAATLVGVDAVLGILLEAVSYTHLTLPTICSV
eukprot:11624721-Alexandrium_andersonii.AAC.1